MPKVARNMSMEEFNMQEENACVQYRLMFAYSFYEGANTFGFAGWRISGETMKVVLRIVCVFKHLLDEIASDPPKHFSIVKNTDGRRLFRALTSAIEQVKLLEEKISLTERMFASNNQEGPDDYVILRVEDTLDARTALGNFMAEIGCDGDEDEVEMQEEEVAAPAPDN